MLYNKLITKRMFNTVQYCQQNKKDYQKQKNCSRRKTAVRLYELLSCNGLLERPNSSKIASNSPSESVSVTYKCKVFVIQLKFD